MLLSGQVSGQQAKEEVSQLVRGLGAVLEEKRASLLQAIEECQQERLARLGAQIQEHRSLLDGSGLVGYAQEVLKETDQPCFVQAAKQLHNRYPGARPRARGRRGAASVEDGTRGAAPWTDAGVRPVSGTACEVLPGGRTGPQALTPGPTGTQLACGDRRRPTAGAEALGTGRAGRRGRAAARRAVPDPCLPPSQDCPGHGGPADLPAGRQLLLPTLSAGRGA